MSFGSFIMRGFGSALIQTQSTVEKENYKWKGRRRINGECASSFQERKGKICKGNLHKATKTFTII